MFLEGCLAQPSLLPVAHATWVLQARMAACTGRFSLDTGAQGTRQQIVTKLYPPGGAAFACTPLLAQR